MFIIKTIRWINQSDGRISRSSIIQYNFHEVDRKRTMSYKSIEFSQTFTSTGKTLWVTVRTATSVAMKNAVLIWKHRQELARQRRHLALLDADQLRDIGVSREEALIEAQRPVSDGPNFRQKHNNFLI